MAGMNFQTGSRLGIVISPFPAAVIVFSVNEGAYAAETMRAALESIPAGQLEAGYCVGMSYLQTMRRIVLPQALRTAFPPLSNSLIAMIKASRVAIPLRKGEESASLETAINEALKELGESGQLSELSMKYFGSDISEAAQEN